MSAFYNNHGASYAFSGGGAEFATDVRQGIVSGERCEHGLRPWCDDCEAKRKQHDEVLADFIFWLPKLDEDAGDNLLLALFGDKELYGFMRPAAVAALRKLIPELGENNE